MVRFALAACVAVLLLGFAGCEQSGNTNGNDNGNDNGNGNRGRH